jgi:hypothetical protein
VIFIAFLAGSYFSQERENGHYVPPEFGLGMLTKGRRIRSIIETWRSSFHLFQARHDDKSIQWMTIGIATKSSQVRNDSNPSTCLWVKYEPPLVPARYSPLLIFRAVIHAVSYCSLCSQRSHYRMSIKYPESHASHE